MLYDQSVTYSQDDFRALNHDDLFDMYKEAKLIVLMCVGAKLIKKVSKDIMTIRMILTGYDAIHNEEQHGILG